MRKIRKLTTTRRRTQTWTMKYQTQSLYVRVTVDIETNDTAVYQLVGRWGAGMNLSRDNSNSACYMACEELLTHKHIFIAMGSEDDMRAMHRAISKERRARKVTILPAKPTGSQDLCPSAKREDNNKVHCPVQSCSFHNEKDRAFRNAGEAQTRGLNIQWSLYNIFSRSVLANIG